MTGDQLREARLALHFSKVKLAETLGVNRATIARWENGTSRIPAAVAQLVRIMVSNAE